MKAVARIFLVTGTVQLMEPVVIPLVYLLHAPAKPRAGGYPPQSSKGSQMIKTILAAAVLVFGLTSAAHAAPVKPAASPNISASSDLVEIGKKYYKRKGKYGGPKYRGRNYYRGGYGRNYNRAPRGWRSYSNRPFGWQRRGCIIVGPVWYCP